MTDTWTDPDQGKSPEQLCAERMQRMELAAQLKQPDRIPVMVPLGYALSSWSGVSRQQLHDNPALAQEMLEKYGLEMGGDATMGMWGGPAPSAALGDQMTKWPGYGLGENGSFQFAEKEFMKAEDYDAFLFDPSDWTLRKYLPRAFSKLAGFSTLPPFAFYAFGYYAMNNLLSFTAPPVAESLQALGKALQALGESMGAAMQSGQRMMSLGLPGPMFMMGSLIEAPFDFTSDTLRGMRGIMLDLHKRPEKLLAAEEKVLRIQLDYAYQLADSTGMRAAGIPLHRGSDGFLSLPQFEKFYWPQLKEMIEELIAHNIRPFVYYEGVWDQRLQYLAALPKGKSIGAFQNSDIFKVKEVLGDVMSIMGGMPVSLLAGGTVEEVRAKTKELCEKIGRGGGYIMYPTIGELEGTDPRLVKAWVDATKEFGQY